MGRGGASSEFSNGWKNAFGNFQSLEKWGQQGIFLPGTGGPSGYRFFCFDGCGVFR
jgi:hypothetical protein